MCQKCLLTVCLTYEFIYCLTYGQSDSERRNKIKQWDMTMVLMFGNSEIGANMWGDFFYVKDIDLDREQSQIGVFSLQKTHFPV